MLYDSMIFRPYWVLKRYGFRCLREVVYGTLILRDFSKICERCVELPFGREHCAEWKPAEVLEVGNVLRRYFRDLTHTVVDKYEKTPYCINEDILTYDPLVRYRCIISISTLEHIGYDEEEADPDKVIRAIARIRSLLTDDGVFAFTAPVGYNKHFDELIRTNSIACRKLVAFKRLNRTEWEECSIEEAYKTEFGKPYAFANGVILGEMTK